MEVISLDKNKVKIYDNHVTKISNQQECNALIKAKKMIKRLEGIKILGNHYKIHIPEIYNYVNGIIDMERCFGDNLELLLRHNNTYQKGVNYTNQLLNFFIKSNFYWKDFAPRNILINQNEISIMDFERGITNNVPKLNLYLVDSVYEEYGAFILLQDRIFSIDDVFTTTDTYLIDIENISSKRVRTILQKLGFQKYVSINEYILAVKMIVINELPYKEQEDIIFPILELEEYIKENGYLKYADKIIGGFNDKKRNL